MGILGCVSTRNSRGARMRRVSRAQATGESSPVRVSIAIFDARSATRRGIGRRRVSLRRELAFPLGVASLHRLLVCKQLLNRIALYPRSLAPPGNASLGGSASPVTLVTHVNM